jgi:hypothetical protein
MAYFGTQGADFSSVSSGFKALGAIFCNFFARGSRYFEGIFDYL